jgi:hemerythrin
VKFVAEVFRLAELLSQGDQHMHRQILDFTRSWYTAHVLGTDRKYKEFLKERGVQ